MRIKSVRIRLTLWYAGAFAAMLTVFSMALYGLVRSSLVGTARKRLEEEFGAVREMFVREPDEMDELEEHGVLARFSIASEKRIVHRTMAWGREGLDRALTASRKGPFFYWISPEGRPYFFRLERVPLEATVYTVAVADDGRWIRSSLRALAAALWVGVPCSILIALAAGYLLAGRTLSPVGAMAAAARDITVESISERLPVENAEDEFGRLAMVFNDMLGRLEDAFDRLRRFTADASHELRTPLATLKSTGEVAVQTEGEPAYYRDVIGSMLEEVDRLARLADDLLTLTRADSGRIKLKREKIRLGSLVEEIVECLRPLAEEKGQELTLETGGEEEALVDPSVFRHAVMNLVENAVRYTPPGGHIRVAVRTEENGERVIEVVDDGPGIPSDEVEKIFDRFYRIEKHRSSETGGTGLGLSIARWAAEVHGARIDVETEEGRGTRFTIRLPEEEGGSPPGGVSTEGGAKGEEG